ncbi:MAG TPA: ABC transporter substrate-binding protein [Fimbriimonadaceae bacterium]|nr:ABC transporter substrate-binding protein [Fimbriimonadaceae bacterium]
MKWYGFLAIATLAVTLVGCGKTNSPSGGGTAQKSNILTYALINRPTEFDPAMVQDGDTIDLIQNIFEGLTTWSEDNQVVPNLAKSWDVTDGGRTYVFHLKQGVKFHNGREMTADDVAFSINRAVSPALASQTVDDYLDDIVGYKDAHTGKTPTLAGIKVIDKYTISITIDKPRPYFLGKLTYPASFVVAKEALTPGKKMTSTAEMIGTGPFMAAQYVDGQVFHLKAFKEYHEGAPKIDGIDRPIMTDAVSRFNAFKRGELDYLPIQRQDIKAVKDDPKLDSQLKLFQRPSIYYVGLNSGEVQAFKDKRVRQAFAMAIDRDLIVNDVLGGQNVRADSFLPPGVFAYREKAAVYPFDVKQAQQLMAQAGYPGGKGFPELKIAFRGEQTDVQLVAESVASQLHNNLGISVGQDPMEWGAYLDRNNRKKNAFFHMRWAADYLDPQDFISLFFTSTGNENKIFYNNPKVDELCAKADSDLNPDERKQLYAQAEDIVLQDAPIIPIYFQRDAELISPRVKGLRNSLFGHLPHITVSLDNQ